MLLQILRTLEAFATKVALVWFKRYMNTNVRGNMIALYRSRSTRAPATGKVQVIGALSSDMALTNMLLQSQVSSERNSRNSCEPYVESLGRVAALIALIPLTRQIVIRDILLSCRVPSRRSTCGSRCLLVLARHIRLRFGRNKPLVSAWKNNQAGPGSKRGE